MATIAEIAELRLLIDEPNNVDPYSDAMIGTAIDTKGVRGAAAHIWEVKAATVASLADISEGGSSRKMSDLHKNYLALADRFRSEGEGSTAASAPRSRRGERA